MADALLFNVICACMCVSEYERAVFIVLPGVSVIKAESCGRCFSRLRPPTGCGSKFSFVLLLFLKCLNLHTDTHIDTHVVYLHRHRHKQIFDPRT